MAFVSTLLKLHMELSRYCRPQQYPFWPCLYATPAKTLLLHKCC